MIADALYVGDTTVERVMLGDVEVWSAAQDLPVVTITGTESLQSQDQFRQACIDYGTTFDTVEVLPFLLDTSQATDLRALFRDCPLLTTVPDLDTLQVTNMNAMFRDCPLLTTVPDLDTLQVTNAGSMFRGCISLTDGNVRLIGRHPDVSASAMISGSGLTREPFYDSNGNPI